MSRPAVRAARRAGGRKQVLAREGPGSTRANAFKSREVCFLKEVRSGSPAPPGPRRPQGRPAEGGASDGMGGPARVFAHLEDCLSLDLVDLPRHAGGAGLAHQARLSGAAGASTPAPSPPRQDRPPRLTREIHGPRARPMRVLLSSQNGQMALQAGTRGAGDERFCPLLPGEGDR